jgi:hypothetical protein
MNYRTLLHIRVVMACAVALAVLPVAAFPSAAQSDPAAEMLARINAVRIAQKLPPYAYSEKLAGAAQAHSKDMAASGKVDRAGTDGSSPKSRILAAGYGQWTIGPIVDEAIYGGTDGLQGAFDWWMNAPTDKGRLLSTRFREVGIGAATSSNGWIYWTLDLGAQPNVLPAFINGGVTRVDNTIITLTLTTENAVPAGEGANTIGQPVQVRVASDDSFTGTDWQPWAAQIPFQLLPKAQQNVYVLYRDAQGRTVPVSINVTLTNVPAVPTATSTRTPTITLPPTLTREATDTPRPTATFPPSRTPTPTVAGIEPATLVITGTPPTETPSPSPMAPIIAPPTRSHLTPRPRVTPTVVAAGPYDSPPRDLPLTVCALQAVALVLGVLIIARRSLNRLPPARAPEAAKEQPLSQQIHDALSKKTSEQGSTVTK